MDDLRSLGYIIFVLFLTFLSCSNNGNWAGVREVRDGVEYVQNTNQGIWNDSHELLVKETVRFGAADEKHPGFLKSVCDLDVDSKGQVYICDHFGDKIHIFNAQGEWLTAIEYTKDPQTKLEKPLQIEITSNDELWVLDNRSKSIHIFDKKFKFLKTIEPKLGRIYSLEAGIRSKMLLSRISLMLSKPDSNEKNGEKSIIELNSQGKIRKSFGSLFSIRKHKRLVNPFANCWLTRRKEGGLYETFHAPYAIRIYDKTGKLTRIILKQGLQEPEIKLMPVPGMPVEIYMLVPKQIQVQTFELPDGKILTHVIDKGESYAEECSRSLLFHILDKDSIPDLTKNSVHTYDLFDKTGRFLQTFELKQYPDGIIKYVDQNGRLYVRSTDEKTKAIIVRQCGYKFKNRMKNKNGKSPEKL